MNTCCRNIKQIKCSTVKINERIVPIQYINDTLVVEAPMFINNNLSIGDAIISTENGIIDLPAKTLVNGTPLISDAFTNISLPPETIIDGYVPTTEQYFYFFTTDYTRLNYQYTGYLLNGTDGSTLEYLTVSLNTFPFIAPEDCVLTSFKLIYICVPDPDDTPPSDGYISLEVLDTELNTFFTGISYNVIEPSPDSRTVFETQFEYYLKKGDSVGLYISGTAGSPGGPERGGLAVYATLGYRVIPPTLLSSMTRPHSKFLNKTLQMPRYNRFPFNNLMNFQSKFPISFEDQLEIISTRDSKNIYGRPLTEKDYQLRMELNKPSVAYCILVGPDYIFNPFTTAKQDATTFLFTNQKQEGYFIDFSPQHQNTLVLEIQKQWKGFLFGTDQEKTLLYQEQRPSSFYFANDLVQVDYQQVLSELDAPKYIDYLSFDLDSMKMAHLYNNFLHVFEEYEFGFITLRHDGDYNIQSRLGNILITHQYIRIFTNIMIKTENKWKVSEDWYIHKNLLEETIVKCILEHPDNTSMSIKWTLCRDIILSVYKKHSSVF